MVEHITCSPLKVLLSMQDLDPHLTHLFLEPIGVYPKWHLDKFSHFAQLSHVPNTQT